MALTRKMLKAMGIEEEKIDQIVEAHVETVDALKAERDELRPKAAEADEMRAKLEKLENAPADPYKAKYEETAQAFEDFKAEVETAKARAEKDGLYREVLKGLGIEPSVFDSIMRVTNVDEMEIEDGKLKDVEKITENAKQAWSGFIVQKNLSGADVTMPPNGGGQQEPDLGSLSMEDYIAARKKN